MAKLKSGGSLKKVPLKDLSVGMYVHDVGRRWFDHPWAKKSRLITSKREIDQLREYGINEVIVDEAKAVKARDLAPSAPATVRRPPSFEEARPAPPPPSPGPPAQRLPRPLEVPVPLEEELPRAHKTYMAALEISKEFMTDLRAGRQINVPKVHETIENMIDSTFRNLDATLTLTKLKTYDDYTFTHCLNVTALAVSFGCHLHLSRDNLRLLGLGAMLHDVGKTGVSISILNKPARLTEEEFGVMKMHPALGARILEQTKEVPSPSIDIALHHHERLDGNGYPDGLKGQQINAFITIVGLADVYDALSSERIYHRAAPPHEALKIIFTLRDTHFESVWVERFVQCLGIYPAGTLVRLNTGEIGLVVDVNRASMLRPILRVLVNQQGFTLAKTKVLDLGEALHADRKIVEVLSSRKLGLDVAKFLLPDA
jgi:HD-GYP domain-containing protein (c-di-GMP phosphodiesterase class II)